MILLTVVEWDGNTGKCRSTLVVHGGGPFSRSPTMFEYF